ncbi:hypothetical protein FORC37_3623 [Vibrio vulnificus]|nr:hypothetical protein FORC37_3623 [Vibrio vulnificus]
MYRLATQDKLLIITYSIQPSTTQLTPAYLINFDQFSLFLNTEFFSLIILDIR